MRYKFVRGNIKDLSQALTVESLELNLRVCNMVQATQNYLSTASLFVGTCAKSTLIYFLM